MPGRIGRVVIWIRVVSMVAGGIVAGLGPAGALEPERPDQDAFLTRAVHADDRLWLLSDAGVVSSMTRTGPRVRARLGEKVYDLCVAGGHAVALSGTPDGAWNLRRLEPDGAPLIARIEPADGYRALACADRVVTILTVRRLVDVDLARGGISAVPIADWTFGRGIGKGAGAISVMATTPREVWLGFNAGEWGGGLYRIERSTGAVTPLTRAGAGGRCGAPVDPACAPITAIAPLPWKPGCLAVAIGLVHFDPLGAIVELCGTKIAPLYSRRDPRSDVGDGRGGFGSVAFFGLVATGDELVAVGTDGLTTLSRTAPPRVAPMPRFDRRDGIRVSFARPHLVLVLTEANERRSMSGAVPMLIPR